MNERQSEMGLIDPTIYDNEDYQKGWGESPDSNQIPGQLESVRNRAAKTPGDLESLLHEGELGLKVQGLLDKGLSVGARLHRSGEVSLFVGKHKDLIGGAVAIAAGVTTVAGVLILHKNKRSGR